MAYRLWRDDEVLAAEHRYTERAWACCGSLRVTDPRLSRRASDPLHPGEPSSAHAGVVRACEGEWMGFAVISDRFVGCPTSLTAWARGTEVPTDGSAWEAEPFGARVRSGLCGIFDEEGYPRPRSCEVSSSETDAFYQRTCAATAGGRQFGLVAYGGRPVGVVCGAGFGDGWYAVYVRRNASGLANAVRVVFLREEGPGDAEDSDEGSYEGSYEGN